MKRYNKQKYEKPQTEVILLGIKTQLLETSVPVNPGTTPWQW